MRVDTPPTSVHRWLVAAATVVSFGAYLRWSQELRYELRDGEYKSTLVQQFLHERGLGAIALLQPVSTSGLLLVALWILACAAAGIALRRAFRLGAGRMDVLVFALAAAVVPPMVLSIALWPDGRGTLTSVTLIAATAIAAAIAAGVALWRARRRPAIVAPVVSTVIAVEEEDAGRGWGLLLLLSLVPLLLAVWWNGIDAIRGFDSLADHLPRAARWLALGRLTDESGTLLTPYYPGDFQLLVRWILVLGTDAYAFVPSLLAAILSLVVLYAICRELGQRRWTAMVSTTAAASCALVPYLATTVEADTATTAFLLLGVLSLMRWLRISQAAGGSDDSAVDHLAPLAAMGTALGLAVGTKYSALPPALVLAAMAGFCAFRRAHGLFPGGKRYLNARTFVILFATILVPIAVTAGYWFVRNLVVHHNPFYPLAVAGMPGVDMRLIIPIKPSMTESLWTRATYPWVQWDFVSVYDDGLGAAFAGVALVAFLVLAFRRPPMGSRRRFVWWTTFAAYALWIQTGSITARFGLFPLLLTFVFVGELWREYGSVALKAVTAAAVLLSIGLTTRSLVVGAVYTTVMPPGRRGVPAIVDSLPPARIFNATAASNRYPLLGRDYRHEVITMFGPARPEDRDSVRAEYMLLSAAQVPRFVANGTATLVAKGPPLPGGDTLSLWRTVAPSRR